MDATTGMAMQKRMRMSTNHKRAFRTIESLLDVLQMHMEANDYEKAEPVLDNLGLYFAHMNDEQTDYYQVARHAVEEGTPWRV